MFFETLGNKSLGQGAMDFFMADFLKMKIPIIANKSIRDKLESLKLRGVNSIFIECGIDPKSQIPIENQKPNPLPDRKQLDEVVFNALGLTEEERMDVYRAVCQLVWNRISRTNNI